MKTLNAMLILAGGMAAGAALGILFAPQKGEDTRAKITNALRKRGIKLSKDEIEDFVEEIVAKVKI